MNNFNKLVSTIQQLHKQLQQSAANAVNQTLSIRNWLIGYYIVEFEQNGKDRAEYGTELLNRLSEKISIQGLTSPELSRCRQFYKTYPQILGTVSQEFKNYLPETILVTVSQKSNLKPDYQKKLTITPQNILSKLSYSHIVELIKIEDELKRSFYEIETIKGSWSVRELRRQINSLYFERSGLSKKPEHIIKLKKMKHFLTILLLSLLMISCQQTDVQYYENGNKKSIFRKKGDQFHGESVWYHENGKPSLRANYKEGQLHGKSINYYFNGEKELVENYENGVRQGKSMKWYNNGKLKEEMFFVNDTLHGEYNVYYKDGQIQVSGAFHHGLYDGQWVWWNQIGLKVGEAEYEKGDGLQTSWYLNGRKKAVIPYKNNEMQGKAKFFNEQGKLTKVITYENGEALKTEDLTTENNL